MMRSLRVKLLAVCMAVVLIPVVFLNRQALAFFDQFTRAVWQEEMRHIAQVTGRVCLEWQDADPLVVVDVLRRAQQDTDIRLRWLGPDGRLKFDSDQVAPDAVGFSWADQPEVKAALGGAYHARWWLTEDRDFMYYQIAQPVKLEDEVVGVLHATRHTGPIMRAIKRMINDQRRTTLLALGLAATASIGFAYTLTRRLRRLSRVAHAHARGETTEPFHAGGRDEIADLSASFDHLTAELARRNRYNREFMSTVVHELRSPLTAIRGAAELLQQGAGEKPESRAKFVDNIGHQAERLIRLVGELSELTRVDTGGDEDHPRAPGDLRAALSAMLDRAEPAFAGPDRARLARDLGDAPLTVRFNAARIEQVVVNLLENAFRYTPADGTVTVHLRPVDGWAELVVADTGVGIDPADLPHVFNRFFTTEPRDTRRAHGSGIGLAIARSIVEQHGGEIRAESEPGRGARLVVRLPRA
jgi:two-component system, OmpR family, sensor histidine kinase ChvG